MSLLKAVAPEIWECSQPLRVTGMELGHRMTVVRLGTNGLWIHSPVEWSTELEAELGTLGVVRHVVAPNRFHDLYLEGWRSACRTALFWAAPGLRTDSKFPFTGDLSADGNPEWGDVFDIELIGGMPSVNELVYRHHPSRTLIVADAVFNLPADVDFATAMLARANGIHGRLAVSRLYRSQMKDKEAVAASVRRILTWEFDRLLMGHGNPVVGQGTRALFATAWSWLPNAFPQGGDTASEEAPISE
jgi:hypothetical protein